MVELRIIEKKDLLPALIQHKKGFLPTFIKYKDKINPVFRNYFDFKKYYNSPYLTMFWIIYNNQRVGQI